MLKNNRVLFSICAGTLIGITLTFLVKKFSSLSIDNQVNLEINPLEIFFILINVFLAIYITRNLAKLNDRERKEKDLIIEYISDFKNEFSARINKLVKEEVFESPTTNSTFKILRIRLSSIMNLASEYSFIEETDENVIKINETVTDIWELFTDAPRKPDAKTSTAVKKDIERLNIEKLTKIETSTVNLEKLLFKLVMNINKK